MFNNLTKSLSAVAIVALLSGCMPERNNTANFEFNSPAEKALVDQLYDKMSVEERAAQLYGLRPEQLTTNGRLDLKKCRELMPNGIGHICQFADGQPLDADGLRQFVIDVQNYLMKETPAGIPAVCHDESISGFAAKGATIYPQQIGLACAFNTELAEEKTRQTAQAMRSVGATLALSPMMDLIRTAHWSRIEESYGEDAYLSAAMANSFVQGLQGGDLRKGVAATTKHFLGYGGGGTLPWKEIEEEVLFPHEVAIRQAGAKVVMTCYDQFRSEQAVVSDTLINVLLRGQLGFDGVVVTDYSALAYKGTDEPEVVAQSAIDGINVGNDIDFPSGTNYSKLPELIKQGCIDMAKFEASVKRTLLLKAHLGLLDPNPTFVDEGPLNLDRDEWRHTSYELASQSVVMLKNNGTLPLRPELKKVALVGPNAYSVCGMLGDYTWQSMRYFWMGDPLETQHPRIVTLADGLRAKAPKSLSLAYERGCEWSVPGEVTIVGGGDPRAERVNMGAIEGGDKANWQRAMQLAAESEVVVAALGENPMLCGENRSRKGIGLPGEQERFLRELIATGKPVVAVVFGGRPQALGDLADQCAAVLEAWYPGEEGGNAVADILLGNVSPSGKLSVSYPRTQSDVPYSYTYGKKSDDVAYPFGHGLSYTTFAYDIIEGQTTMATSVKQFQVSCTVTNTGKVKGDEVVQLYLSPADGQPLKPIQLKGFKRVSLAPGQSSRVTFNVFLDQLAHYDNGQWTIEPGKYDLRVGTSSADLPLTHTVTLTGKAVTKQLRDYFLSTATAR